MIAIYDPDNDFALVCVTFDEVLARYYADKHYAVMGW